MFFFSSLYSRKLVFQLDYHLLYSQTLSKNLKLEKYEIRNF